MTFSVKRNVNGNSFTNHIKISQPQPSSYFFFFKLYLFHIMTNILSSQVRFLSIFFFIGFMISRALGQVQSPNSIESKKEAISDIPVMIPPYNPTKLLQELEIEREKNKPLAPEITIENTQILLNVNDQINTTESSTINNNDKSIANEIIIETPNPDFPSKKLIVTKEDLENMGSEKMAHIKAHAEIYQLPIEGETVEVQPKRTTPDQPINKYKVSQTDLDKITPEKMKYMKEHPETYDMTEIK